MLQDLSEQQRVFHQSTARDVQEVPQVQLPAEGRLETALQEVLHPPILLLLVQQGLGLHLVTAVRCVGGEEGQLQGHRYRQMTGILIISAYIHVSYTCPILGLNHAASAEL